MLKARSEEHGERAHVTVELNPGWDAVQAARPGGTQENPVRTTSLPGHCHAPRHRRHPRMPSRQQRARLPAEVHDPPRAPCPGIIEGLLERSFAIEEVSVPASLGRLSSTPTTR